MPASLTKPVLTAALTVYRSSGGVFDSSEPAVGPAEELGSTTLVWAGCNEGVLSYDLSGLGLSGDTPIEGIVLDNVPACEAAQQPAP